MKHILLLPLLCAVLACGQQRASGALADSIYAQPGQLVSVGGFRLNLYCIGSGSPAVVFDSGFGDWAPAWSKVQPEVAKWTRACSYDRAGTGFSDAGPMPRTSVRIARELRTALHHAGITGPYILVGSAFGGDHVRTFADLYMDEVAGLVLVDADSDDVGPEALREASHRGHVGLIAGMRACRDAIAEHRSLQVLKSGRTCPRYFFRGLPEREWWSPQLNAKLLQIAETKVAMYDADISEMEQTPADEIYLQRHRRSLGSRPIRVLTSGNHGIGDLQKRRPETPEHVAYERQTTLAQAQWLTLSTNARQIFVPHSSEYIQFDAPQTVIEAIRDVYDQAGSPALMHSSASAFRDCGECPEMVVIPAGRFIMGSSPAEKSWAARHGATLSSVADEAPQHEVSVSSFALGKYDVTRDEYAAFVRDTGYLGGGGCGVDSFKWRMRPELSWQHPGFEQTPRDPVVCVSWNDAHAYIEWLNHKASHGSASDRNPYRLPSEAEWEYAARAGSTTAFWWGDDDSEAGTHAWYKENAAGHTHVVGSKPGNAFGLFDIVGNVWQWTEDCYDDSYAGAPVNGRAKEVASRDPHADDSQGKCLRVDRGSSWLYPAWLLRSATRERNPADFRDAIMGFRVAKTVR
jgi:formylglycine-generating enzyme required for sulfatase activity